MLASSGVSLPTAVFTNWLNVNGLWEQHNIRIFLSTIRSRFSTGLLGAGRSGTAPSDRFSGDRGPIICVSITSSIDHCEASREEEPALYNKETASGALAKVILVVPHLFIHNSVSIKPISGSHKALERGKIVPLI